MPGLHHRYTVLDTEKGNRLDVFLTFRKAVLSRSQVKEVPMSEKCQLNVTKISGAEIEVLLIGKGKEVVKRKQSLPKGEMLVLGGNAPNSTAWLVVLKRIE